MRYLGRVPDVRDFFNKSVFRPGIDDSPHGYFHISLDIRPEKIDRVPIDPLCELRLFDFVRGLLLFGKSFQAFLQGLINGRNGLDKYLSEFDPHNDCFSTGSRRLNGHVVNPA